MRWPTNTVAEQPVTETPAEAPKRKGGGIFRLIKAVAFVSVIVVVQIVGAAMLAPSAQDTAKLAKDIAAAASGQSAEAQEEHAKDAKEHGGHEKNLKEVELGSYNITRYNPTTNTTLAIDFELFGTVLAEDAAEFATPFRKQQCPHQGANHADDAFGRVGRPDRRRVGVDQTAVIGENQPRVGRADAEGSAVQQV